MRKYLGFVIGFMFLASMLTVSSAYILHLVIPVNVYLQPLKPTDVSPVGPGYTVVLAFDRNTQSDFVWDNIVCTTHTNWNITYASDHKYLYALLKVPKTAEAGSYIFSFKVSDRNGDHVQEDAQVRIHVTRNPNDLVSIHPLVSKVLTAGNDSITFTIDNKALGRATYLVHYWSPNLARSFDKLVTIEPGKTKQVVLPVSIPTEGFYTFYVNVTSEDTPIIHAMLNRTYYVRPTLKSKLLGIANGFPVVPVPMVPIYTLLGLFASW